MGPKIPPHPSYHEFHRIHRATRAMKVSTHLAKSQNILLTIHTRHVDPVLQYRDMASQSQLNGWSDLVYPGLVSIVARWSFRYRNIIHRSFFAFIGMVYLKS
ncbi:uncharacterized protein CCOS01_07267 [Colletotrichum costaricense]|uniref:Uncharacterized protein n=1 Tax=Colletotrichum costaricense TaxID=1209916 RepID=A0AAI9YXM1_9PEZI|nr:uncharacterized protein CCOS01_07267 [Colletotrichum costaricense]KAK1527005.1 hypothetical protein CCOS01_07267 [Colletotrichum costaricense]